MLQSLTWSCIDKLTKIGLSVQVLKHGFIVNNQSIKWQYVTQFYGFYKANTIRMAPKLQDKHINLPPFSAIRVHLAAQV